MLTPKPCTTAPRHQWEWVKNVNIGKYRITAHGTSATFSLKGLYRCQCGAKKHGQFNPNGADLRNKEQPMDIERAKAVAQVAGVAQAGFKAAWPMGEAA